MKFENTEVSGIENAILGMRLPLCKDLSEAKEKSDSYCRNDDGSLEPLCFIGNKDLDLAKRLIKVDEKSTGQPNSKFLRMINVSVCVTAPLYWWKEADTYKVSTVTNSTSTMHKLASTPITIDCFEMSDFEDLEIDLLESKTTTKEFWWDSIIVPLELLRQKYNETKDKRYWKELVRLLPESWLQTRMWSANYAVLRTIFAQRKNHKLTEWHKFCEWIETLPYAKEFICS